MSLFSSLRQHRTIVPASLSRLFATLLQFEKREIHTVFLRFPNFELGQKSCLRLLAELCGAALKTRIRENGNGMNPRANARVHNPLFHYIIERVLMATGIAEHIHSAQSA